MANTRGNYAGMLGWSVGRYDWLEDPSSKVNRYWRAIEQGSTYWVGKTIIGLWGPAAGENVRPNRLISGGPLDPTQTGGGGQKFVPFFASVGGDMEHAKRRALWYFFGGGTRNMDLLQPKNPVTKSGKPKSGALSLSDQRRMLFYLMTRAPHVPFVSATVGKPIIAAHYYENALIAFGDPAVREIDLLQQQLAFALGSSSITSARGRAKAQAAMGADTRSGVVKTSALSAAPTSVDSYLLPGRVSSAGNNFGRRGLATVTATVHTQDFIRDGNGSFSNGSWQNMVKEINATMAKQFQAEVVRQMQAGRTPRPATRDLIRATENPRNRFPE